MLRTLINWIFITFTRKRRERRMAKDSKANGKILMPTKRLQKFVDDNEDRLYSRPHYIYVKREADRNIYAFLELMQLSLMDN